ncbi:NAD-dependent epimerase/dehydratase family protein [Carnobacterium sp.]|uniref:NAD-dependent epimerase/dehydratase family protein n=1 Tax=Carnobacterium sp. TaxID=48221 RepID=UPI0028AE4065|nr:NAD-dependent epimerase/dehydratase family protein [Carnobacterium sp.]
MKNILVTGKNSYIGTSLDNWLMREPNKYQVDTMDTKDNSWRENTFSQYDAIYHVAGIAHVKETGENEELYYKVNRDLAYEVAKKAKLDGVKQFIFLSSMSVYGLENGIISIDTQLKPNTAYGKSKIEAEKLIKTLADDSFIVAILRPPMVYGKGCKGNYPRLAALAMKTPIFPNIDNKRSMIYIDNLSEFVKQLIDNFSSGLFFPQNAEYVNTGEMVNLIAKSHGKKLKMLKLFNPLIKLMNISIVNKVFGNLIYEMSIVNKVDLVSFKDSIEMTEKN